MKKMQNTNYVKDNIILINLLKEFYKDNEVSKVFGISELLRATIFFVKKQILLKMRILMN